MKIYSLSLTSNPGSHLIVINSKSWILSTKSGPDVDEAPFSAALRLPVLNLKWDHPSPEWRATILLGVYHGNILLVVHEYFPHVLSYGKPEWVRKAQNLPTQAYGLAFFSVAAIEWTGSTAWMSSPIVGTSFRFLNFSTFNFQTSSLDSMLYSDFLISADKYLEESHSPASQPHFPFWLHPHFYHFLIFVLWEMGKWKCWEYNFHKLLQLRQKWKSLPIRGCLSWGNWCTVHSVIIKRNRTHKSLEMHHWRSSLKWNALLRLDIKYIW